HQRCAGKMRSLFDERPSIHAVLLPAEHLLYPNQSESTRRLSRVALQERRTDQACVARTRSVGAGGGLSRLPHGHGREMGLPDKPDGHEARPPVNMEMVLSTSSRGSKIGSGEEVNRRYISGKPVGQTGLVGGSVPLNGASSSVEQVASSRRPLVIEEA